MFWCYLNGQLDSGLLRQGQKHFLEPFLGMGRTQKSFFIHSTINQEGFGDIFYTIHEGLAEELTTF
jgi:hypothetical protein